MSSEEIENEIQAGIKLSQCGHKNIVSHFQCGYLPKTSFFFLDMALCDLNLETYIRSGWPDGIQESLRASFAPGQSIVRMWEIMMDICSGVAFIHEQKYVHRDLKPRNGEVQVERF